MDWKRRLQMGCLGVGVGLAGVGLLLWPQEVLQAGRDGLSLCGGTIFPALFPFFVLSSLAVGLGLAEAPGRLLQPLMAPLFRVNGGCASALLLGLIGGYPVGARTAAELYRNGLCSKTEAERLLGFCNNSGPAFLLGAVGAGVFGSARIGLLLWGIHVIAALAVGFLFRFYRPDEGASAPRPQRRRPQAAPVQIFVQSVSGALASCLQVCAFVLLFAVLLRLITRSGALGGLAELLVRLFSPLGLTHVWCQRLLGGMLELSNGVAALPAGDLAESLPMAAFLLGWGGVSVLCQTLSQLQGSGLSLRTCVAGKLLHGGLSALLALAAVRFLPWTTQAAALSGVHVRTASTSPVPALLSGAALLLALCLVGRARQKVK